MGAGPSARGLEGQGLDTGHPWGFMLCILGHLGPSCMPPTVAPRPMENRQVVQGQLEVLAASHPEAGLGKGA